MRRSKAWVGLGWFVTVLSVATVSMHSQAANSSHSAAATAAVGSSTAQGPELFPLLAKRESLHGSFMKSSPQPDLLAPNEACPSDMVEVEGEYCPLVEQKCLRWLDAETQLQCAEFEQAPPAASCPMKSERKHFCVDRFEWPNKLGALPSYMASWYDAKASCEATGKRLCSDTEWTLACEGPQRQPYPYGGGYARDDAACNIDKPYIWPHPERVNNPRTRDDELARLDQREPSGSRPACVSPFGVRDMVGNVDEWVVNVSQSGQPHMSGLKGGYWGPVRTRCRPMTTAHDEQFRYYQIGFRCCGELRSVDMGGAPIANR